MNCRLEKPFDEPALFVCFLFIVISFKNCRAEIPTSELLLFVDSHAENQSAHLTVKADRVGRFIGVHVENAVTTPRRHVFTETEVDQAFCSPGELGTAAAYLVLATDGYCGMRSNFRTVTDEDVDKIAAPFDMRRV